VAQPVSEGDETKGVSRKPMRSSAAKRPEPQSSTTNRSLAVPNVGPKNQGEQNQTRRAKAQHQMFKAQGQRKPGDASDLTALTRSSFHNGSHSLGIASNLLRSETGVHEEHQAGVTKFAVNRQSFGLVQAFILEGISK